MGYDRCPYLSFFIRRYEDEIFVWTGWRDLNTEYTILDLRCRECLWCKCECKTLNLVENGITRDKLLLPEKRVTFIGEPHKWLDWGRENNEKGRKMIQLHWWSKVVSLGKRLHIICLMRPELPVYQGNMKRWDIIYYHWSDSLKDNEIKYYQLSYKW